MIVEDDKNFSRLRIGGQLGGMDFFYRAIQRLNRRGDGDTIDHLNASTTVTVLIVAALIVSAKQYVGQPIQCWVPAQFTRAMEQYTENYCYVQSTYWIGTMNTPIPEDPRKREAARLNYYQWVPFILLGQAALFYTPRLVWRAMSKLSGVNFRALHTMAHDCQAADIIKGEHMRRALADYIIAAVNMNRGWKRKRSRTKMSSYFERNLCPFIAFLATKFLYLLNATGQLFLLNGMLAGESNGKSETVTVFGGLLLRNLINEFMVESLKSMASPPDWTPLYEYFLHFPYLNCNLAAISYIVPNVCLWQTNENLRTENMNDACCMFKGSSHHRYTVQCVLMINMFNEKLFAVLWLWTVLVAMATFCSAVYWCCIVCLKCERRRFIWRLLTDELPCTAKSKIPDTVYRKVRTAFLEDYLHADGVFLLRSIDAHVGSVVTSRVLMLVYQQYLCKTLGLVFERETNSKTYDGSGILLRENAKNYYPYGTKEEYYGCAAN